MMKVRISVEMLNGAIGQSVYWISLSMPMSHIESRYGEGVTMEILEVRP